MVGSHHSCRPYPGIPIIQPGYWGYLRILTLIWERFQWSCLILLVYDRPRRSGDEFWLPFCWWWGHTVLCWVRFTCSIQNSWSKQRVTVSIFFPSRWQTTIIPFDFFFWMLLFLPSNSHPLLTNYHLHHQDFVPPSPSLRPSSQPSSMTTRHPGRLRMPSVTNSVTASWPWAPSLEASVVPLASVPWPRRWWIQHSVGVAGWLVVGSFFPKRKVVGWCSPPNIIYIYISLYV